MGTTLHSFIDIFDTVFVDGEEVPFGAIEPIGNKVREVKVIMG